ncbi:plasmid mobilization protein [Cereibacter azotoformans]|uniref:plasmid mobilization protein n=1 Tax=Cereibacter azotoformans TaxID=43057 RepID=UPI0015D62936|nr:plasmid mobilization relaxosome protein MobC [Cereibacter azotoformans]
MARPGDGKPRSNSRRTTVRLTKRITEDQLRRFEIRAEIAGFETAQDYLSALILGEADDRIRRKDAITLLGHLGRIGSNLNQVARAINSGRVTVLGPVEQRVLEELREAVEGIGRAIRGSLG